MEMDREKLEKAERIRASKRECARKAREKAKLEGKLTKSDEKKERLRVIKQTIDGGDTHLDKLLSLDINLSVLTDYCDKNNCNLNKIKPHILEFLQKGQHLNIQQETHSDKYDHIFTLETFLLNTKSPYTARNYLSHLNSIKQLLGVQSNQQFIDVLKDKPIDVCTQINQQYRENVMTYIAPIIFIIRKFADIKQFIGDEVLKIYTDKLSEYKQQYLYLKMIQSDGVMSWDQIVELKTKIEPQYKYGFYHLLISLYTCIPPMRDDFGSVKIIPNDTQLNKNDNFYVIDTNNFHFNHYKTQDTYKSFQFKVPYLLQDAILGSLKLNPRPYLITQNLNKSDQPYKDGKLTQIIPKFFKIDQNTHLTINDFRHAFETYMGQYGIDFELEEKRWINQIIGHDSDQRDFYIRDQIRSKPLFRRVYNKTTDVVQRISDKIGGFYDIGDKIDYYQPPPPIKKIKLSIKNKPI